MRARASAVLVATILLAGALSLPRGGPPAAAAALPRISFAAAPGASILVHGTYPPVTSSCLAPVQPVLHSRFEGTVEVGLDDDGSLFVIDALPFEDYLKGIAEVPRTWHLEALKAQVVAARSYALAHVGNPGPIGDELGYDLCATDACQVYRGLGISAGPYGHRWERAVDETAGQVLLYQGRPADAVYSSTSKGHTVGNEQVFGSAPLPYLRPVTEKDDGASPLSHWRVAMPFSDVARFLRAAGDWGSEPVGSVTRDGPDVVVKGGGATETISITDLRSDLNSWAHCLEPAVYPTIDTDGVRLPQTVPSKWFSTSSEGASMVLTGRGWGHGVGMVQWGAEGKAARGLSSDDILAYYYGGLRPAPYAEPATIRVGVAVGLRSVVIQGTGPVIVPGRSPGPGPWIVTGGDRLELRHTEPPPSYVAAGRVTEVPSRLRFGKPRGVFVSIPQLSVVHLVLRRPGPDVQLSEPSTHPAGTAELEAEVPDGVASGTYELQAVVTNGIDIERTKPVDVSVKGSAPSPSPSPSPAASPEETSPVALPAPHSGNGWALPLGLAAAACATLAAIALRARRRRRSSVSPGS